MEKNAKCVIMAVTRRINGYSTMCDIKFGHRIVEAVGSFDYEIHNSIQIIFHSTHKWSKCAISEFSEIMLHK